ncbi:MAG: zinc ABC transporter substrate-binding protein [Desulfobacterales bacterium]|jgi:zinc transport system substrate-binding protein
MVRLSVLIVVAIGIGSFAWAASPLPVFVSIAPQNYFVQQIGRELVNVQVMLPSGADPHTYEPKPRQMAGISKAKGYFAIGVPFENAWLEKIAAANPGMTVVHTDDGIEKIPMATHHQAEDEAHHEAGTQGRRGLDPHIWLSPALVKIQARTIMNALQKLDPSHHAVYQKNYQLFVTEIDRLDNEIKTIFAGKRGLRFMVFHPSWGYFARAYGLKQVAVEIEGKDPKPAQLKELIEHAREKDINIIFVQPQFSIRSAKLLAKEIGGQVAVADPLAEDWLGNLRNVASKFRAALK